MKAALYFNNHVYYIEIIAWLSQNFYFSKERKVKEVLLTEIGGSITDP